MEYESLRLYKSLLHSDHHAYNESKGSLFEVTAQFRQGKEDDRSCLAVLNHIKFDHIRQASHAYAHESNLYRRQSANGYRLQTDPRSLKTKAHRHV